jgi:hypothetical protein
MIKKVVSYILIVLVILFTVVALLGIWDIIDLEHVMTRIMYSLIVIFAASAVVLFIFNVIVKDNNKEQ